MLRILKVSFFFIGLHFLPNSVFAHKFKNSQNNRFLSDSVHENIIVVYDTVLLPPDTIRITDTVAIAKNTKHKPLNKKGISTINRNLKSKDQNKQSKYTLSICFSPFITAQNFFTGNFGDSVKFSSKQPVNFYYEISSGLRFNNWILFAGLNFTSFSEISKKEVSETKNVTTVNDFDTTYNILTSRQIKNYFCYAGILFGVSYNFEKRKFIFCPQTSLGVSRKLPNNAYKFDDGINVKYLTADEQTDYVLSLSLSPSIAFKATENFLILLLPAYNYNVKGNNVFPITYSHNFRLGIGMKFEL